MQKVKGVTENDNREAHTYANKLIDKEAVGWTRLNLMKFKRVLVHAWLAGMETERTCPLNKLFVSDKRLITENKELKEKLKGFKVFEINQITYRELYEDVLKRNNKNVTRLWAAERLIKNMGIACDTFLGAQMTGGDK